MFSILNNVISVVTISFNFLVNLPRNIFRSREVNNPPVEAQQLPQNGDRRRNPPSPQSARGPNVDTLLTGRARGSSSNHGRR